MESEGEEQLKPRPYQEQLEEIAIRKNTIIHLPTGSGKTFIAIRLISLFKEALEKPWGEGGKRTFFLVNTIPLVEQQRNVIDKLCPVEGIAGYSSEDKVDFWKKPKWDHELSIHQVIVMTSQILSDMLTHQYIKISDINLLIFDECHHAVDDHPMRLIMKKFEDCPVDKQPRVLGLTATLLNANSRSRSQIEEQLRMLETTFHATIATVNELGEVLDYSTKPYESVQYYRSPRPTQAITEALGIINETMELVMQVKLPVIDGPNIPLKQCQRDITKDPKKIVKAVKSILVSLGTYLEELGAYGGSLATLAYMILLERLKRKAFSKEESLMYKFVITAAVMVRDILERSMENEEGFDRIVKHSSDQVLKLLQVLKEYNPEYMNKPGVLLKVNRHRKPLSGIIFTKQRFTAKILYNLLKEVKRCNEKDFGFLQHEYITGFNINPFNNTREESYIKKINQTALLKYSNKELNCLISTSVIEEGVDIRQCLLVLRYDPPLEYRSYIQSKGRARSNDASFLMLVNIENQEKFEKQYASFQSTESYIHHLLVGQTEDRDAPSQREIQGGLYDEDEIPPYVNQYGGRLSAVQAISLLNRYSNTLPHDQFTVITPFWISEPVDAFTVVTIILPIASQVKEPVKGIPCLTLKSAKRSAALNACIRLHQTGELEAETMLPKTYGIVDFEHEDVMQCFLNWPLDAEKGARVGGKKQKRKYKKVFPSCLNGPKDWKFGQQSFHLHVIRLKTTFEKPTESREAVLYEFLHQNEGFGLLTVNTLPSICDFPMFLTVGEVTTSIEVNYATISLDKDSLELVKRFHFYVFNQVLQIAKKFIVFDGTVNCLYAVPIIEKSGGCDVNWQRIRHLSEIPPVTIPSYDERKKLNITRESYKNSIVTPWYRSALLPDRYVVSDVLEYLTPSSRFDLEKDESSERFSDYYSSKYNLQVIGRKDQPLLEVRNISSRMNCLLPRAVTLNSLTDKQKKLIAEAQGDDNPKAKKTFKEIFIPEFCTKYEFPGVLWYKAVMLPSIIHRVTMLLMADELRVEIAKATKIGQISLKRGEKWKPIAIDWFVTKKSMLSQLEAPAEINTIDRINNPIDDSLPRPVKVQSMNEVVYQLQRKKISNCYNWDETSEPIDIERNIATATVMDIECYDEFVTAPYKDENPLKDVTVTSARKPVTSHAAILPPPLAYKETIRMLSQQPTARGPELRDVLVALTMINAHDTFDLERFETLGDSFLKFAATLYLYHKFPALNEGQLTNIKGRLISNRNLFYAAERIRLGGRMKTEQFSPRKDFLVPGFLAPAKMQRFMESKKIRPSFLIGIELNEAEVLSGDLSSSSWDVFQKQYSDNASDVELETEIDVQSPLQAYVGAQAVTDKSVADCIEALIGTYLQSCGLTGAIRIVEWLRVLPAQDNFESYLHKRVSTAYTMGKASVKDIEFLLKKCRRNIEEKLDYKFKDPALLLEALSHPSYIQNRQTRSYERLEFLGDAILDFLVTMHIFEYAGKLDPGQMTDLRSALVNNVTFASYVVKLGLHKFICYQFNPLMFNAIISFVEHQEQRNHEIVEDVLYLIDEEDCHLAEYIEVPKVLSDIFESLAGAIYLDSGGDLQAVWRVYYKIMWREIDAFTRNVPKQPVRLLHENIHACPLIGDAIMLNTVVPKVMVPVTISVNGVLTKVHGVGNNKFQAKRAAAKLALKVLAM